MMNCNNAQEKMLYYLENNLPDDFYKQMSEHIDTCEDCQKQIKIWNTVLSDIQDTEVYYASNIGNKSVQDNVMNYIYTYETHRNTFRKNISAWNRLAAAAAAFAILFAGYAGYSHDALVKSQSAQVFTADENGEKKPDVVRIASNEVVHLNQDQQPLKVVAPYSLGGVFVGIGALSLYMRKRLEKQMKDV